VLYKQCTVFDAQWLHRKRVDERSTPLEGPEHVCIFCGEGLSVASVATQLSDLSLVNYDPMHG